MKSSKEQKAGKLFSFSPYLLFFLASFIFFGFVAEYICFYHEKSSLFVFSGDFLRENSRQPGALLLYFAKFLSSFYYYSITGALIISAMLCLTVYFASETVFLVSGKRDMLFPVIIGLVLFFLQTNYQYMHYNTLGVMLQLAFFSLTVRHLKGWLPVLLLPLWYYITGGFTWIFLFLFAFYLITVSFKEAFIKTIAAGLLYFLIIFILKEFFLFQTVRNLMLYPMSNGSTAMQYKIFHPLLVLIILTPVLSKFLLPLSNKISMQRAIWNLSGTILLALILSLIMVFRFESKYKHYFHAEKLFYEEKYEELISYNVRKKSANILTSYLNNIALCETGQLNDRLFYFPQSPDGQTLFLKWEQNLAGEILRRGAYFYYTVGMINEAQRWAFENMVIRGHTPEGLKMLIRTELINGNYKRAAKYISLLKRTLFYRKEAMTYERLLSDEAVDSHPVLGVKRKEKITHDFFSITDDPFINIEYALALDTINR
ncbi:MAG: hypothetical protein HPY62_13735, partial [Bacteroidales bacterium]|nr:hypothetical protein [Bacteroidales bacterium]